MAFCIDDLESASGLNDTDNLVIDTGTDNFKVAWGLVKGLLGIPRAAQAEIAAGDSEDISFTGTGPWAAMAIAAGEDTASLCACFLVFGFGDQPTDRLVIDMPPGADISVTGTAAGFTVTNGGASAVKLNVLVLLDTEASA